MGSALSRLDIDNPPEERRRLLDTAAGWKKFGPYLSDRQWGTVREDYSRSGEAWSWFTHDDARRRAYRWGEDGLLGYCDETQSLCFSLSCWNGRDPILKSRLWGLTNDEGVHGEDVKEMYWFDDATPTASYLRASYRYPIDKFPYKWIADENRHRKSHLYERGEYVAEFELLDTGIFDNDRFFDVTAEYFKNSPMDTSIAITVENASDGAEMFHLLPTLLFRNTWSWVEGAAKPVMRVNKDLACAQNGVVAVSCDALGDHLEPMTLLVEGVETDALLFCDNETDIGHFEGRSICRSLYKQPNTSTFPKDGIDKCVVNGRKECVNPEQEGSKMAAKFVFELAGGSKRLVRLRLLPTAEAESLGPGNAFSDFDSVLSKRVAEADAFYSWISPQQMSDDRREIQRTAFAGMIWSKMTYNFAVNTWLEEGPQERLAEGERNRDWVNFRSTSIISCCDGFEYPWFALWDWAFHNLAFAMIDPEFAKEQVMLPMQQTWQHSNGMMPAYEWEFGDYNPPLSAWSALKVFYIDKALYGGEGDTGFLRWCFPRLHRALMWFRNMTEIDGQHLSGGSFLGLDNICIVDRSKLPDSVAAVYQADGSAWSGAMSLTMMKIALELGTDDDLWDDLASQFLIDSCTLSMALNNYTGALDLPGYERPRLYSEEDGFFFDVIKLKSDGKNRQLKIPTLVGVIPLFCVETLDPSFVKRTNFMEKVEHYIENDQHRTLARGLVRLDSRETGLAKAGEGQRLGVHMVNEEQLRRILTHVLDPEEFMSRFGTRSASKKLEKNPFRFDAGEGEKTFRYIPGESFGDGKMFGGNSSWRGSIWMPTTYLLIESLIKYHVIFGNDFKIECPTGSGVLMNLREVAFELATRLISIFEKNADGIRPSLGSGADVRYACNPRWQKPLFYEYFHGDTGQGLGASHQLGWTGAVIADLITRLTNEEGVLS